MAIDLRRFHSTFFEESLEGVATMETELLEIERTLRGDAAASLDAERLNRIFRAAHSIKGGSGTFGFSYIAEFAHALESLLDEARAGRRAIDAATVDLVLRAVDCLRGLIEAARQDKAVPAGADQLRAELERAQPPAGRPDPGAPAASLPVASAGGWRIRFLPRERFFHTGNDPLRILRALADLGPLAARADASRLPAWNELDPETCYLGWDITVQKPLARSAIEEVFAWVADECELDIQPASPPAGDAGPKPDEKGAASIRVATAKVDGLVDIVGELVITQTMLTQLVEDFAPDHRARLRAGVEQLERHARNLQDAVLGIRMLPIGFAFSRLPRLARDVSAALGKQVELTISGERTELDKVIIERISDPLIHLVRNSIDHGIEPPDERVRAGKQRYGTVRLDAYHKAGSVIVEVADDGRGLDRDRILRKAREHGLVGPEAQLEPAQIDEFIFTPGLSTAESVNDVSGRGVGLDVVRNNIRTLGGGVEVTSTPGQGTRFIIRLPLTLAIVDGMSLQVGSEVYILPLAWIAETLQVRPEHVSQPAGGAEIVAIRGEYLPLLRLDRLFNVCARAAALGDGIVVVVETDGKRVGLFVDDLLGQQQVVLKSLEPHCARLEGISAATILGDGTVALILDAGSLVRQAHGAAAGLGGVSAAMSQFAAASSALH